MEITLAMLWIMKKFDRPIAHFRKFLEAHKKIDDSVVLAFVPWTGIWALRSLVVSDFILMRSGRWGYLIILIFVPGIGVWMFRGLITISYLSWAEKDLRIREKVIIWYKKVEN
jgi:hypothetical protein